MEKVQKRVFFGVEVLAPWPAELPPGRLLDYAHCHMTLAFLGNIDYTPLEAILPQVPKPTHQIGLVGIFDNVLALPTHHPRVIAWNVSWLDAINPLAEYQKHLSGWLQKHHYKLEEREWLPHVTLCRQPFDRHAWEKTFVPLPFFTASIHLYESIGNLKYEPIWSHSVKPPFIEIEHTADLAYIINGKSFKDIYNHAFIALAFKFPPLLSYFKKKEEFASLDEIIMALNDIVGRADGEIGCPMKAISFHGELEKQANEILEWEMIIDV